MNRQRISAFPAAALLLLILLSGCSRETPSVKKGSDSTVPHTGNHTTAPGGREARKSGAIKIGGNEEHTELKLVGESSPFSTYIPEKDILYAPSTVQEGRAVRFVGNVGGKPNTDLFLHLFMPDLPTSLPEMKKLVTAVAARNGWTLTESNGNERFPWASEVYALKERGDGKKGEGFIIIGMHNRSAFYMILHYQEESAEGFLARTEPILGEWQWSDTKTGLKKE